MVTRPERRYPKKTTSNYRLKSRNERKKRDNTRTPLPLEDSGTHNTDGSQEAYYLCLCTPSSFGCGNAEGFLEVILQTFGTVHITGYAFCVPDRV